jgi:arylsulfatase A-like enzyme
MTDGHSIGHMTGHPDRDKLCTPIRKFHAERVADLARRLDAVKEENGTVLDNTLIIWMSDSGEEHHGFCAEWPMVVLGNLGGRLKTAGRFLQFPKYQSAGHRTVATSTCRSYTLLATNGNRSAKSIRRWKAYAMSTSLAR